MNINLSAANMNELALRVAGTVTELGFTKADKPMVASQGLRVLANLAGHRVEHSLVEVLKAEKPETGIPVPDKYLSAWALLSDLVSYLERNYDEDQFDDSTQELIAEANVLLVGEPTHVIYSPNESACSDGAGFWSNQDGWGALETATRFAESELLYCDMPRCTGDDARPVLVTEAQQAYGSEQTMDDAIEALHQRWGGEDGMHGEHPHYVRSDWQYQVSNGDTHLGYWEWVVSTIEMNGGDENHCSECGKELDGDGWDGRCGDCADEVSTKASNVDELIDELRLDRSDIEFWVRQHYLQDFDAADDDHQERWVHQYRHCHGMTPNDSLVGVSAEELAARVGHSSHKSCSTLLSHTINGVALDVRVCGTGKDAFFEVINEDGDALGDMFYQVPEYIDTLLERLVAEPTPVIDQKTARAIKKYLGKEGQALDVRNKGGVDVTHFAIEDEDIAKFPCLKGVAYVDTWKHGIEVFPETGNSFEVEL